MNSFEYYNPVRVVFGPGTLQRVGEEAAKLGTSAMIVSYADHKLLKPVLTQAESLMKAAGVSSITFLEVEPNPEIGTVERGVQIAKESGVDMVVGIGGGSAMDAAKAIAAGFYYSGDLWNMVYSRHDNVDAIPPEKALPMLMVSTLPATASEMNQCAVVSNPALKEKSYIWGECLFPKTAILDPELTTTLPTFQTACGAADTISHVLEIYFNGQDKSDLLHRWQEGVMRNVIENLPKVLANEADIDARTELQWTATCALNGWASPGDAWTPMHQVGHVLTSRHGINHGSTLSIIMPAWMEYYKSTKPERCFTFATRVMGIDPEGKSQSEVIDEGLCAFRRFLKTSGVPITMSEKGVTKADIPAIVEGVKTVSFGSDGMLSCNPPVSAEDISNILLKAL
ncbi:iron-containing alcohol dehydrogenase [Verrucomicrobiaceae bacterium N1E253]|uniref:Iron-containing alcohol dehydrogenase n=1 Tax=Oceaniferula marina TaxID=2748318 RepID=A0A851GQY8_9BACT|nr:iron-containing alcohol dehydrogenase [Oceaniferula marina]NWK56604.1 iron-containing alcohol dehydrogenase [Oceaniferula marina]